MTSKDDYFTNVFVKRTRPLTKKQQLDKINAKKLNSLPLKYDKCYLVDKKFQDCEQSFDELMSQKASNNVFVRKNKTNLCCKSNLKNKKDPFFEMRNFNNGRLNQGEIVHHRKASVWKIGRDVVREKKPPIVGIDISLNPSVNLSNLQLLEHTLPNGTTLRVQNANNQFYVPLTKFEKPISIHVLSKDYKSNDLFQIVSFVNINQDYTYVNEGVEWGKEYYFGFGDQNQINYIHGPYKLTNK
jgi:hypothetical protein